jgi:hypothetical protein
MLRQKRPEHLRIQRGLARLAPINETPAGPLEVECADRVPLHNTQNNILHRLHALPLLSKLRVKLGDLPFQSTPADNELAQILNLLLVSERRFSYVVDGSLFCDVDGIHTLYDIYEKSV